MATTRLETTEAPQKHIEVLQEYNKRLTHLNETYQKSLDRAREHTAVLSALTEVYNEENEEAETEIKQQRVALQSLRDTLAEHKCPECMKAISPATL
jgi:DNA repair exonuclease SbcCD ATPase subunit